MLDILVQSAEVKGFVQTSQMSEGAKRLVTKLLEKEGKRILEESRQRAKSEELGWNKDFFYKNGMIDFFNAYLEAHNLIIGSQASERAKELLLRPLEMQLSKAIDENRFKQIKRVY